jgi:phage terminase large subunit GpA-like protein
MASDPVLLRRVLAVVRPPSRDVTHAEVATRLLLPDGPRQGKPYRWREDPVSATVIAELDQEQWDSFVLVGAVQTGKSLMGILVPATRQLIHHRRAVVYAQPTQAKLHEAWTGKMVPSIQGAGLGAWLPRDGQGSRGGQTPRFVVFREPETQARAGMLYLIHGGGASEGAQAAVSAPTVLVDEVDSFKNAHRVALIGKRADSFGSKAVRVYASTVKADGEPGTEEGSILLGMYQDSTASRLHFACPHCRKWGPLEWECVSYDPEDEATAAETVTMACPQCGAVIGEDQRQEMLADHRLVHHGQTVSDAGEVLGAVPRTRRFGLLWSALDSSLRDLPTLAIEHYRATRSMDRGDHGAMRSFYRDQLCRPYTDDVLDEDGQTVIPTRTRLAALSQASTMQADADQWEEDGDSWHYAHIPEWIEFLTIGADVQAGGERAPGRVYFVAYGRGGARGAIVGHGTLICAPPGRQPTVAELHATLDRLNVRIAEWAPSAPIVWRGVDTGDQTDELLRWLSSHKEWFALKGTSAIKPQPGDRPGWIYRRPQKQYVLRLVETDSVLRVLHGELLTRDGDGSCLLPHGLDQQSALIRHLCASVEYEPGKWSKGAKDRKHHPEWQRRNDYADAAVYARALAYEWQTRPTKPRARRKYGVVGAITA